jgi:adenylate kinase family enzyme
MPAAHSNVIVPLASVAIPTTLKRIVLTGFMGAGKTSAGRILAASLGWKFLDLDAHLEPEPATRLQRSSAPTAKITSAASSRPLWPTRSLTKTW